MITAVSIDQVFAALVAVADKLDAAAESLYMALDEFHAGRAAEEVQDALCECSDVASAIRVLADAAKATSCSGQVGMSTTFLEHDKSREHEHPPETANQVVLRNLRGADEGRSDLGGGTDDRC